MDRLQLPLLVALLLVFAFSASEVAGDQKPTYSDASQKPLPNNPAFNKLKTLVGEWVLEDEKGNPADEVVLAYRLVSAGSVIQESIFPGQPKEMVTMWHMDGNKMVGTHY